jgi:hypothetical protein
LRPSIQDACLRARVGCGAVSLRLEVLEELHDLPEAMEIKQGWWARRGLLRRGACVVGGTRGDGCMAAIGEADNKIGIESPTHADNFGLLTV